LLILIKNIGNMWLLRIIIVVKIVKKNV